MSSQDIEAERSRLFQGGIAPSTATSYLSARHDFLNYCQQQQLPLSSSADYDSALSHYIAYLSLNGRSHSTASLAFHGVLFYRPELKDHLPYSHGTLKGWIKMSPSRSHPPLTFPLAVLVAITLAKNGHTNEALATLVAFDGFLRINEFVELTIGDVALPTDPRLGQLRPDV